MGVKPTVDGRINPLIERVDLSAVFSRVDVHLSLLRSDGSVVVERGVEDADDLRAFVVHDGVEFLVP
jgi:hypothetical protein